MQRVARTTVMILLAAASPVLSAARAPTDTGAAAYLSGRFAAEQQDLALASERFGAALRLAPADEQLRRRALEIAILSGDAKAAFRHAEALETARRQRGDDATPSAANALVALTAIASAASARAWTAVSTAREGFEEPRPRGESAPVLGAIIDAWTLAARGRGDAALSALDVEGAAGLSQSYLTEHRAHLLAFLKRPAEALEQYQKILSAEGANVPRLRVAAASAALDAGDRTRAIMLIGGGPAQDPLLADARARFARNPKLKGSDLPGPVRSPEDGMALLMMRVATDLGRERGSAAALHFARLGTFIAPRLPEGWLVAADALLMQQQADLAIAALDRMPAGTPWQPSADMRRAAALSQKKDWDAARAILQRMAAEPDAGVPALLRLADLERNAGRPEAAARHYSAALAAVPDTAPALRAQIHFQRGAALERSGDWPAAEPALREAARLQPDNPVILNYLGYSLLDRREKLDEAHALIRKAYEAQPDNGAIIDSMGWAEYVTGNLSEAIRLLEQARAAEPGDATIADHLGDALWKAGRRIEARHIWNNARALQPSEELAAKLAIKLDYGLEAALASR